MCELKHETAKAVTVEEFVRLVWEHFCDKNSLGCVPEGRAQLRRETEESGGEPGLSAALFLRGRQRGWLEEQDATDAGKPLERRAAARIVHGFLQQECMEADETDWDAARALKDLFDCRVCVGHVAQVYVKGIMGAKLPDGAAGVAVTDENSHEAAQGRNISSELVLIRDCAEVQQELLFGMQDTVGMVEAEGIAMRMFDKSLRLLPGVSEGPREKEKPRARAITRAEAEALQSAGATLFVDVRSDAEYREGHLTGAVHIPMGALLMNPFAAGPDKTHGLALYCDRGYQSEIAAKCLAEAGYARVYYFALEIS